MDITTEREFKTLMHCGRYVDANLLENGLYTCSKPFIYQKDKTIESMVKDAILLQELTGIGYITDRYFDNLKQCQLVSILITEVCK